MARAATKQALKWLSDQKEVIEKEAEEDLKKEQALASSFDGLELNIAVKVGDEGQLFESINATKIAEKLKEMGFEIKKSQVKLEEPIKELGEFPISISLKHNLEAEIKVIISGQNPEKNKEDANKIYFRHVRSYVGRRQRGGSSFNCQNSPISRIQCNGYQN
jgi:large subunit ribosomal protein L9